MKTCIMNTPCLLSSMIILLFVFFLPMFVKIQEKTSKKWIGIVERK